jgi:hypothetical protein
LIQDAIEVLHLFSDIYLIRLENQIRGSQTIYIDIGLTNETIAMDLPLVELGLSDLKSLSLEIKRDTNKDELKEIISRIIKNPEIFKKNGKSG